MSKEEIKKRLVEIEQEIEEAEISELKALSMEKYQLNQRLLFLEKQDGL